MGTMFDGPEPIYLQIAQQIRAQILSGDLAEEEQVMSTTQYATTFRINPRPPPRRSPGWSTRGSLQAARCRHVRRPGAREAARRAPRPLLRRDPAARPRSGRPAGHHARRDRGPRPRPRTPGPPHPTGETS
ncbi:GntR family transcriptional regulator [Oerskovia sp. M15]